MMRLERGPESIYYIKDFVDPSTQSQLYHQVSHAKTRWISLSNRRLQEWGARASKKNPGKALGERFPPWLQTLSDQIASLKLSVSGKDFVPNACLVNEYVF